MIELLKHWYLSHHRQSVYDTEELTALELAAATAAKVNENVGVVNEVRQEMTDFANATLEQVTQQVHDMTVDGTMAGLLNGEVMAGVNTRITDLDTEVNAKMDSLDAELKADMQELGTAIDTRMDALEAGTGATQGIDQKINSLCINALYPPAVLAPVKTDGTDTSLQLNAILQYAKTNKIRTVFLPVSIGVSSTITIPSQVELKGNGWENTVITGLVAGMKVVDIVEYSAALRDLKIALPDMTGYPLQVNNDGTHGGCADFIIDNVKTVGGLWAMTFCFCWNGIIRNCRTTGSMHGIQFGSQSNQLTFDTCAVKVKSQIMKFVNNSGVIVTGCELTQMAGDANSVLFQFEGQAGNHKLDTIYMEGIVPTSTFAFFGTASALGNIEFNNVFSIEPVGYLMQINNAGSSVKQIRYQNCYLVIATALYRSIQDGSAIDIKYNNSYFGGAVNVGNLKKIHPNLLNNWVNSGGNFAPAGFWKDSDGIVHLEGMVTGGAAWTTIFVLPEGFRPSWTHVYMAASAGQPCGILINAFGEVRQEGGNINNPSLDGICFTAAY